MIISLYFEYCDSAVDWHSNELYLRGHTFVIISMCLLCITEIILYLCTYSTTLLEKDNVNTCLQMCAHTYVCVQAREGGRR